jgi:hypothetical protein
MTNLINKLLARFQLKLVSTKPVSLVDETVKFLDTIPKGALPDHDFSTYVGDINYVRDKTGKSYFLQRVLGAEDKYFNFDGDTYTAEELQEKLQ